MQIHCRTRHVTAQKSCQLKALFGCRAAGLSVFKIKLFEQIAPAFREALISDRPVEISFEEFVPLRVIYQAYHTDAGIAWCFEHGELVQVNLFLSCNSHAENSVLADLQGKFSESMATVADSTWLPAGRPAWVTFNVSLDDRRCIRSGLAGFFLSAAFCDEFAR